MPLVKTPTRERAKLRLNEQSRMKRAQGVLTELLQRHHLDERDVFELHTICVRLEHAIKNQHLIERAKRKEQVAPEGY